MPQQNTLSHARDVLANADPDFALLHALESFDARDPKLNQLRNWMEQRAKDLSTASPVASRTSTSESAEFV